MSLKDEVVDRFSSRQDAGKWDEMYARDTDSLADHCFRSRRDYAVGYLATHYGKEAQICDIGCGAGPVTYAMLRQGYDIVGLDFSTDMLKNAAKRLSTGGVRRRPLINANCESLPFSDASFDCVVCLGVISYVEHYENILREIYRVLKPGGTVLLSYRSRSNLLANDPVFLLYDLLKRPFIARKKRPFVIGHYMRPREVRRSVEAAGFVCTAFKGIGFGPYSIAHKKLFSARTSIRISEAISRMATRLNAGFLFRIAADVNILVCSKSEAAGHAH